MRSKKILRVLLVAIGALLLLAIVLGVLNALVGDGEWSFGWTAYRYDDTGFEVGGSTVYTETLQNIDIDWVDGRVSVIACDDFCPSLTESSDTELTEDSRVRWLLSEDGKTLTVKYRKSSSFLGSEQNKQKDLVLRVPKRLFDQLRSLRINVRSSVVTVDEIPFSKAEITSTTGDVSVMLHESLLHASVESKKGDVYLFARENPSLSLSYESKKGISPIFDFNFEKRDGRFLLGEGKTDVRVVSARGGLSVRKIK